MSIWKLTLRAIEEHLNHDNDSLFADVTLPTGMDKSLLINTILDESEEFGCIYQDGNYMKKRVTDWFDKYDGTIAKWWELWNMTYNPLHNFDRNENYSDVKIDNRTNEENEKSKNTNLHNDGSFGTTKGTGENKVSADDSADYSPKEQNLQDGSTNGYSMSSDNGKNIRDNLGMNGGSEIARHKGHLFGNIGVTKTQEMYRDEASLRKDMNPYSQIADLFLTEFCIMVL